MYSTDESCTSRDGVLMRRCKTKVRYDTEFQAIVVAARRSVEWGEEMEAYPCGNHYHIAHTDITLRGKHLDKEKESS